MLANIHRWGENLQLHFFGDDSAFVLEGWSQVKCIIFTQHFQKLGALVRAHPFCALSCGAFKRLSLSWVERNATLHVLQMYHRFQSRRAVYRGKMNDGGVSV